jgi:hypothetical protein
MKYLMKSNLFTESKKYIKKYEEIDYSGLSKRATELTNATLYLEENQPITKEEGFIECLYEEHEKFAVINFYFNESIENKILGRFFNFLDNNKLNILQKKSYYEGYYQTQVLNFIVKISNYKIKKYADLYSTMIKYNL